MAKKKTPTCRDALVPVPYAILRWRAVSPADFCVYCVLLGHADDDAKLEVGPTALARDAGLAVATVKRCLHRLVKLGLIGRTPTGPGRVSITQMYSDTEALCPTELRDVSARLVYRGHREGANN